MRQIALCSMLVAVLFVAGGCASGESFVRSGYDFGRVQEVAVVEVVGDLEGEVAKNTIADFFAMELMRKGYTPVERRQVQAILKEQEFQRSDLTSAAGAAAAGRILNVPAVMIVNVLNFGERISMTAKMIDVEDASMLWVGSGSGTTGRTLATVGGGALGAATGVALGGDTTGQIIGGVAGGVVGGVAGYGLSPQETTQAHRVVKKICHQLPARGTVGSP